MTTELTLTQTNLLSAATAHPAGRLTFPDTLRGGARTKVINALVAQDLIADDDDGWCLTEQGYAAMGFAPPDADSDEAEPINDETPAALPPEAPATKQVKTRESTKQATVIALLKRPEGATLAQLREATGWQAHTVRGCLAGALKKRLGLTITSAKSDVGDRTYHAV